MLRGDNTNIRVLRRALLISLAVVGALLLVAATVIYTVADVERYRPQLEQALKKGLGQPAKLGDLRLALWPSPHVDVDGLEVEGEGWRFSAEHLRAWVRLMPLLQGRARLSELTVQGLRLSAASASLYSLPFPKGGAGEAQVSLEKVIAPGFEVWLDERRAIQGNLTLSDLQSAVPKLRLEAAVPALGEVARVTVVADAARGEILLEGVRPDASEIMPENLRLPMSISARTEFTLARAAALEAAVAANVVGELDTLSGTAAARVWWQQGQLIVNDLLVDTPALKLHADLTWRPGETCALRIHKAEAGADAFPGGEFAVAGLRLRPGDGAQLAAENVLLAFSAAAPLLPAEGRIIAAGLDMFNATGDPLLRNVSATAALLPDGATLETFRAQGIEATGRVDMDVATGAAKVSLVGTAQLEQAPVEFLWPGLPVTSLAGTVQVKECVLVSSPSEGVALQRLAMEADGVTGAFASGLALRELYGGIAYEAGSILLEDLRSEGLELDGTLQPEGTAYVLDLRGEMPLAQAIALFGALPLGVTVGGGRLVLTSVQGIYPDPAGGVSGLQIEGALEKGRVEVATGKISDELANVTGKFSRQGEFTKVALTGESEILGPLKINGTLGAGKGFTGDVVFSPARALALAWREPDTKLAAVIEEGQTKAAISVTPDEVGNWSVQLSRKEAPQLAASLSLLRGEQGLTLGAWRAEAQVPAASLVASVAPNLQAEGMATVRAESGGGNAAVDFTAATLRAGRYLEKRAGDPLLLTLQGQAAQFQILSETIPVVIGEGGVSAPELNLDLAQLSALFSMGGASGQITGSFDSAGPTAALQLNDVAVQLAENVSLESVTGGLALERGFWRCENLAVQGAGSEFNVSGAVQGSTWNGAISGPRLNLDALLALWSAWNALNPGGGDEGGGVGLLEVNAGEVLFRRGTVADVQARVHFEGDTVRAEGLSFSGYGGNASGAITYSRSKETVRTQLEFANMDLRAVDDMILREPKSLSGAAAGTADITAPVGTANAMAGISGRLHYTASSGSYGKLGGATRLLSVLKTAELFRLHLPSLRDDGLTFKATSAKMSLDRGLVTVEEFGLRDTAYAMNGEGTVDYAANETNLNLHVHLLEAVSGIIGAVPVLRSTIDRFRDTAGIQVDVTGPPADPKFDVHGGIQPVRRITEGIGNVVDGVLRRSEPAEEAETPSTMPEPAADTPPPLTPAE